MTRYPLRLRRALALCSAAVAGGTLGGCGPVAEVADAGDDGGTHSSVLVSVGTEQRPVTLATLSTTEFNGAPHVRLDRIALAAWSDLDLAQAQLLDMRAGDGFIVSSRGSCQTMLPLAATTMQHGYVEPATRGLRWETNLGFPGCMTVADLAEILIARQ
jgi:hypothetical protein